MLYIKILFTYDYGKEQMGDIRNLGYEIIAENEHHITFNEKISDVDVLVCYNPFSTLDITKLKNLKWIQLSSVGIDQTPLSYLKQSNIILTNNRGGYSIPMGEWVVLKILELIKNSKKFYEKQVSKVWKTDTSVLELYGKTIGFIGTGSIAQESAKRLQGFESKMLGVNTSGKDVSYFHKCFPIKDLKYVLPQCDIIVVSVPYTKETHHLIDERVFTLMKDGVKIINVARGSIMNEDHLYKYLTNGKIESAALDVFEKEPLDSNNPLWDLDNVIITPHNSWVSEMRNERRYQIIYENLKRYIKGEELINVVNLNKGY